MSKTLPLLLVLCSTASAQPKIERVPTSADAIELAWMDMRGMSLNDSPFVRYIWIRESTLEKAKAVALACNYWSRAAVVYRPQALLGGAMLRIDIRKLAPQEKDLDQVLSVWENLRFDPSFNLLITKDSFSSVAAVQPPVTARIRRDGKFYSQSFSNLNLKDVDVVRLIAPHLNLETVISLQDATGSAAPVVEAGYFLQRSLTAFEGKGLWNTLYSGLYYELAGIPESKDSKSSDEDLLFRALGVGSESETAAQVFERLRSDQRTALFRRVLNKKPTRIDFLPTLVRRGGDGVSLFAITHDLDDESIDVGQHPIMNLSDFKDDAREGIFTKANGMPGYVLYNGKGKLQRFVPQGVAEDRGIPDGHRPILQPPISCIHCHEASGNDGWQPVGNDVQDLLKEVDVFADLSRKNKLLADTLDRLGGQYLGSPSKLLQRARDDYAETVLRVTGPWKASKSQTDVVKLAAKEIVALTYAYRYDPIDAQRALLELGLKVPKESARDLVRSLFPPGQSYLGISPEDARVAALKAWKSITRNDFDLVRAFMAMRLKKTLESLPQPKEMK